MSNCTFIKNKQGEIIDVRNEDGSPSKLFQDALQEFGNKQQAIDIVAITKSLDFLEVYPTDTRNVYYHGGNIQGELDIKRGDFGIHFGTAEQAQNRLSTKNTGKVKAYTISYKNPIMSVDMGWWDNLDRWKEIGYIPNEYQGNIVDELIRQGYDSIIYDNEVEGEGQSIIVLDASIVKEFSAEPSLQTALDYVAAENANKNQLSPQQTQDLKNSLMSSQVESLEEFQDNIKKAFYTDGTLFSPTEASLTKSGLYSPYEVQTILRDIDLQQTIKNAVEALNNTDVQATDIYLDTDSTQKTTEFNSFGKLSAVNPYEVRKAVVDTLGGINTQTEFDQAISELEYPVPMQGLFQDMQKYTKAQQMIDVDGQILPASLIEDKRAEILLGMSTDTSVQTISNIDTILSTPDAVLDENAESLTLLLTNIENNLIGQGLDVVGMKDQGVDKEFLAVLRRFLLDPSVENMDRFLVEYGRFFNVTADPQQKPLKVDNKNRTYVYLETKKPEDLLLVENNLLKSDTNNYIKVRRQSTEDMYNVVASYPEKYPQNEDLREYVQRRSAEIENIDNRDVAEELALLKLYFGVPMNIPQEADVLGEAYKEEIYEPTSEDFITDFQKERLKQKQKDSAQWKNFYRHFNINNKGINLINTDSITLDTLNIWIDAIKASIAKGLKQFSVISTQLPNLNFTESQDNIIDKNAIRSLAINYPLSTSIPKLSTESYVVDNETLIAKNTTEDFLRVGDSVYESVESKGSLSLYVQLPKNDTYYNMYKNPAPKTDKQLQDYMYLETTPQKWVTPKNKLSKEKRTEIQQENFNC